MTDVSQHEYEALAGFRYALRQFAEFSERAAKAAGLPPQQHQALLAIRGFPQGQPMTIGALAERLCLKPQSTSELVSRMERQGLLLRRPNEEDGRSVHLEITGPGTDILHQLSSAHREELRRLRPHLEELLHQLD